MHKNSFIKRGRRRILDLFPFNESNTARVLKELGYFHAVEGEALYKGDQPGGPLKRAIELFQEAYGLRNRNGVLDSQTREAIKRARCSVREAGYRNGIWLARGEDPESEENDPWQIRHGTMLRLSYALGASARTWRTPIVYAVKRWEKTGVVTFVENDRTPQIVLEWTGKFIPGDHNFGENLIAHAVFPSNPKDKVIHFNDEECWADGKSSGCFNVYNVVLHELGHVLGLGHANSYEGDIMKNRFDDDEPTRDLSGNDENRLKTLYGFR